MIRQRLISDILSEIQPSLDDCIDVLPAHGSWLKSLEFLLECPKCNLGYIVGFVVSESYQR